MFVPRRFVASAIGTTAAANYPTASGNHRTSASAPREQYPSPSSHPRSVRLWRLCTDRMGSTLRAASICATVTSGRPNAWPPPLSLPSLAPSGAHQWPRRIRYRTVGPMRGGSASGGGTPGVYLARPVAVVGYERAVAVTDVPRGGRRFVRWSIGSRRQRSTHDGFPPPLIGGCRAGFAEPRARIATRRYRWSKSERRRGR